MGTVVYLPAIYGFEFSARCVKIYSSDIVLFGRIKFAKCNIDGIVRFLRAFAIRMSLGEIFIRKNPSIILGTNFAVAIAFVNKSIILFA